MLLPYTTLTYYGAAACAMVVDGVGEKEVIEIRGDLRVGAGSQGAGEVHYMRPIRLRGFPMESQGIGEIHALQPRMSARMALDVAISQLSQDDVVGALQTMRVEGDITFAQLCRALLAIAAGNATGLEGATPVFKAQDGTTTRIAASLSSGNRTITTLDLD